MSTPDELRAAIAAQADVQMQAAQMRAAQLNQLGIAMTQSLPVGDALQLVMAQLHTIASVATPDGSPLPEPLERAKRAALDATKAIHGAMDSVIVMPARSLRAVKGAG